MTTGFQLILYYIYNWMFYVRCRSFPFIWFDILVILFANINDYFCPVGRVHSYVWSSAMDYSIHFDLKYPL